MVLKDIVLFGDIYCPVFDIYLTKGRKSLPVNVYQYKLLPKPTKCITLYSYFTQYLNIKVINGCTSVIPSNFKHKYLCVTLSFVRLQSIKCCLFAGCSLNFSVNCRGCNLSNVAASQAAHFQRCEVAIYQMLPLRRLLTFSVVRLQSIICCRFASCREC